MIGKDIKQYLISNGISQTFVSKKSDVSIQILNAMLNEKRTISAEEYFDICKVLNVPLNTFKNDRW